MFQGETYAYCHAGAALKRVVIFGGGPHVVLTPELEAAIKADMAHHAGKDAAP